MDFNGINLLEVPNSVNNFDSVEIKQELIETFEQSQLQPTLETQHDEINGEPEYGSGNQVQADAILSCTENFSVYAYGTVPIVSMTVNSKHSNPKIVVPPSVHRCTGKISTQRRWNTRAMHPIPRTLYGFSTTAANNQSGETQVENVGTPTTEQDDGDEVSSDEPNDTEDPSNSQPMEIDDFETEPSNGDVPIQVTEVQKRIVITAWKSPAVKTSNNVAQVPAEPTIKLSDDDMDDEVIINLPIVVPLVVPPVANPTVPNQQAQPIQQPSSSSAQVQNVAPNRLYCTVCEQQYSSSKSLYSHKKTLKHAENLKKQSNDSVSTK